MIVSKLTIENFRGIRKAEFEMSGHTLLIGGNNVGKSTICEALELALSPDRQNRFPVVDEYDFYNASYLDEEGNALPVRIEVLLTNVTPTVEKSCANYLERWDPDERRILGEGEIDDVDNADYQWCLRILTLARYNSEEDEFEARTFYAAKYNPEDEDDSRVPRTIRRCFGFLYLRALRTGSRALSLERGSLLDVILRIQSLQTGIWEHLRTRLMNLDPPIEEGATKLTPVLQTIEQRVAEYIAMSQPGNATRLFVSQLTREHLRKTISFFISLTADQKPVPFQAAGTGTLNTLVLALLSFIAEIKEENVIFAMEEPEIALPPHTQRRIANYLIENTTQCLVTSHSPYVIEKFEPPRIMLLQRSDDGAVIGKQVTLGSMKAKTYRRYVRRGLAEAMLGRGVVVAEGLTEHLALSAIAEKMQTADENLYPLDLAGITLISADGDGNISELGGFIIGLGLPTFAFLDKKKRPKKEVMALAEAGFEIRCETAYPGMEELLATEVPLDRQWQYLEFLREQELAPKACIPADRPDDDAVRALTKNVLKDHKGWGRAAELVEYCALEELPPSITNFLNQLFAYFPKPKIPPVADELSEEIKRTEEAEQPEPSPDDGNATVKKQFK
jgi:putative ATP-dependent endonuclease of the OLD family